MNSKKQTKGYGSVETITSTASAVAQQSTSPSPTAPEDQNSSKKQFPSIVNTKSIGTDDGGLKYESLRDIRRKR